LSGDGRTYEYVVGRRAVTSTDSMTADSVFPWIEGMYHLGMIFIPNLE
jgi:GMP synthase PP-ATPase subunit